MATPECPVVPSDGDALVRLGEHLKGSGYSAQRIGELLGTEDCLPITQRRAVLPLCLYRTRHGSTLETLTRLFHLGCPVEPAAAKSSLAPIGLLQCAEMGLLNVAPHAVCSAVELIPYEGLMLAADWPSTCAGRCQVMGVAASSRTLARMAVWPRGGRVLDWGTGCGVLALLARRQADGVTAVDSNARAIRVARFNMLLNGSPPVDWREADFFEPLAGQTFELVLCNPPFVISPRADFLHSHSGRPADQLCQALVRATPSLLREGGYFQMVFNWAQVAGQDWWERLQGWFHGIGCDALLMYSHVQDAAAYAMDRLGETVDDPAERAAEFDRWIAYYERENIEAIGFGLLTLRRTARPECWFELRRFRPGESLSSATVLQAFMHRDFLAQNATDARLLTARLRPADGVVRQQKHALSAKAWTLLDARLGLVGGLSPTSVPAGVVDLVAWCDGRRPVGDYLRQTVPFGTDPPRAEFAATVRHLVELGLLEPAPED